jgi:hypothetical protein
MMSTSRKPTCETCVHYQAIKLNRVVIETVCRRYPPVVIMQGRSSAYPLVLDDDTCGEYKPRT